MKAVTRIKSAEVVIHGVVKLVWNDGYEGVVDLRPVIDRGRIFEFLKDAKQFRKLKLGQRGHSIYWLDADGEEVDFGSDNLRRKAEKQAELHKLAAEI
jgi:hypothetical protein